MKTILLCITCSLCLQTATIGAQNSQQRIAEAFGKAFSEQRPTAFENIGKELPSDYWKSYADYYQAIYFLKTGEKGKSRHTIEEGIKRLENLKEKNSEDYALLSVIRSFSIQFVENIMRQGIVSGKVKEEAQRAIAMDEENIRAYYALACIDFYTPKEYGGGIHTEKILLKAITLKEQHQEGTDLPTWGKDAAYQLLISFYLKEKEQAKAQKYWEEAGKLYPGNRMIENLKKEF